MSPDAQTARAIADTAAAEAARRTAGGDVEAVAAVLMTAMGCKMEEESPEGPCCAEPAACGGHGVIHYCTEHDWHENDNTEGVCGYALMLAEAIAAALPASEAGTRDCALAEHDGSQVCPPGCWNGQTCIASDPSRWGDEGTASEAGTELPQSARCPDCGQVNCFEVVTPTLECGRCGYVGGDLAWTFVTPAREAGTVAEALDEVERRPAWDLLGRQHRLYAGEKHAGWDPDDANSLAEEIAHLHEEVAEAFRAYRQDKGVALVTDNTGKPQGVPAELADVVIGIYYIAERFGFDLDAAIETKHRYNLTRSYAAEGRRLHEVRAAHPGPPS